MEFLMPLGCPYIWPYAIICLLVLPFSARILRDCDPPIICNDPDMRFGYMLGGAVVAAFWPIILFSVVAYVVAILLADLICPKV